MIVLVMTYDVYGSEGQSVEASTKEYGGQDEKATGPTKTGAL